MTADRQATAHTSGRAVLLTAALGTMLAPLNSTMIVVALPEILDDFGHSLAWGSWIVISYLVAMAAVQPLGGSLGDRYGRRRMLLVGFTAFLVATVVAALAPSVEVLLVARTVQALSGAMAIPNGTALVRSLIPQERQGRAFGMIGSGIAVAAAAGPPLGGIITDAFGWRWIFVANLLLLVPALVLASRLPAERGNREGSFDLRGALLMTGGLVSLALALTSWRLNGVPIWSSAIFGLLALTAGIALRRHVAQTPKPILNLALFQRPGFLPASLTVLLSNLTMYTTLLALPVFLTEREGWRSSQVGLLLAAHVSPDDRLLTARWPPLRPARATVPGCHWDEPDGPRQPAAARARRRLGLVDVPAAAGRRRDWDRPLVRAGPDSRDRGGCRQRVRPGCRSLLDDALPRQHPRFRADGCDPRRRRPVG